MVRKYINGNYEVLVVLSSDALLFVFPADNEAACTTHYISQTKRTTKGGKRARNCHNVRFVRF